MLTHGSQLSDINVKKSRRALPDVTMAIRLQHLPDQVCMVECSARLCSRVKLLHLRSHSPRITRKKIPFLLAVTCRCSHRSYHLNLLHNIAAFPNPQWRSFAVPSVTPQPPRAFMNPPP